jgi:hypothetical protein
MVFSITILEKYGLVRAQMKDSCGSCGSFCSFRRPLTVALNVNYGGAHASGPQLVASFFCVFQKEKNKIRKYWE